jgi:hypothetical protein
MCAPAPRYPSWWNYCLRSARFAVSSPSLLLRHGRLASWIRRDKAPNWRKAPRGARSGPSRQNWFRQSIVRRPGCERIGVRVGARRPDRTFHGAERQAGHGLDCGAQNRRRLRRAADPVGRRSSPLHRECHLARRTAQDDRVPEKRNLQFFVSQMPNRGSASETERRDGCGDARKEAFGPVVVAIPFDTEANAVDIAKIAISEDDPSHQQPNLRSDLGKKATVAKLSLARLLAVGDPPAPPR